MQPVRDRFALGIFLDARSQPLLQFRIAHLQQRRERMGHDRLLATDHRGIRANHLHRNAGRQEIAVRIQNVATFGRAPGSLLRFFLRLFRQLVVPPHLQIHQPEAQPDEGEHHQRQQRQRAFELLLPLDHLKTTNRP